MRVHDIKLKMPERFGGQKRHTSGDAHIPSLSARAGFCDRDHSVRNVLSDKFDANGRMAKYFHDETEYCDEEAALQDRTVRPRGELILCVYAKRVKLWSSRPRHGSHKQRFLHWNRGLS
jgi:hypothetical protein